MSLILDALKRSERHRRRHAPGMAAGPPAGGRSPDGNIPRWGLVIGTLLAVNAIALVALLRPWSETPADTETEPDTGFRPPAIRSLESIAERGAWRREAPASDEPAPADSSVRTGTDETTPSVSRNNTVPAPEPETGAAATDLPTAVPEGVPELSLDVHVHTNRSDGRFVVINMTRYREGERLREGPMLERITEDGAVLSWQGSRFLLPR